MKIVGSCYVNPQAKLVHLETQNLLLAQSSHDLMWDPLRKVLLQGSTPHSLPKKISRLTLYENRNTNLVCIFVTQLMWERPSMEGFAKELHLPQAYNTNFNLTENKTQRCLYFLSYDLIGVKNSIMFLFWSIIRRPQPY